MIETQFTEVFFFTVSIYFVPTFSHIFRHVFSRGYVFTIFCQLDCEMKTLGASEVMGQFQLSSGFTINRHLCGKHVVDDKNMLIYHQQ